MTNTVQSPARRGRTPDLSPTRQAAIENALTMALHFVRQQSCAANTWAATSRAIRAATLLKQACEGLRGPAVPVAARAAPCAPLVAILCRIVQETMDHPTQRPLSADSYLPPALVEQAQEALALYGASVAPAMEGRA